MKEKGFLDGFKLVGSIGAAFVGLSGFALGTYNSIKKAAEMKDDKEKEVKQLEDKSGDKTSGQ